MDYTQLTDDELRRKVLELMGYSVESRVTLGIINYVLCKNGNALEESGLLSRDNCWKYAPDPLTDANVYMGLVDEMASLYYDVTLDVCVLICSVLASKDKDNEYEANNARLSRAICEVYCQVKEKANV